MRALLIDDDPVTRRSVTGLLERLAFGVVEAADASTEEVEMPTKVLLGVIAGIIAIGAGIPFFAFQRSAEYEFVTAFGSRGPGQGQF